MQAGESDHRSDVVTIIREIVERREPARLDIHGDAIDRLLEQVGGDRMSGDRVGECRKPGPNRAPAGQGRLELESPGIKRPGLVGGGGRLVRQVVGVPQECVKCTHRPPLHSGKQQESIVEVPGLSPRQSAAESVAGPESLDPSSWRVLRSRRRCSDFQAAYSGAPFDRRRHRSRRPEPGHPHRRDRATRAGKPWSTASRRAGH